MTDVSPLLAIIASKAPNFSAKLGVVLGSGLGDFVEALANCVTIPYHDLPGFADCAVEGHAGQLCLGYIDGTPVACLQGRPHWYEGVDGQAFVLPMQLLAALGCEQVVITNSAGALNPAYVPGSVVLITDHINLQGRNPLKGGHFISMQGAYDAEMRAQLYQLGQQHGLPMAEGVYVGVLGPSFETPAEIAFFRNIGGDVIAMSMIADVIAARYAGLRVAGVSLIVNAAASADGPSLSHEVTLAGAQQWGGQVAALLQEFIQQVGKIDGTR